MPKTRGRPRSISPEQIVQAVLDEGLMTFSMPTVGRRIGVAHSGLYRYFEDREALLSSALATAASSVPWPSPEKPWRDQFTEIGDLLWQVAEEFPGFSQAILTSVRLDHLLSRTSEYVDALGRQGFSPEDAVAALDIVVTLALTSSLKAEQRSTAEDAAAERAAYQAMLVIALAGFEQRISPS